MKRLAVVIFYAAGALAIVYLALHAYGMLTQRDVRPGSPIRIFKKHDAPKYSRIERNVILMSSRRICDGLEGSAT